MFFKNIFKKKNKEENLNNENESINNSIQDVSSVITKQNTDSTLEQNNTEEKITASPAESNEEIIIDEKSNITLTDDNEHEEIVTEVEKESPSETLTETVVEEKDTNTTEKKEKKSLFAKLKEGLEKTKKGITAQLDNLIFSYKKIDEDFLEEVEEILITSDMGVELTMDIIDHIKVEVKKQKLEDPNEIKNIIKKYLINMLNEYKYEPTDAKQKVILIIGVNGVGKTTSIGKLAYRLKSEGKNVMVAAGDTFRAAAVEQLKEWCDRADVELVCSEQGSDPGSVIYDSIKAAKSRNSDVLICDTAGRLHNKKNLMNELSKIFRIIDKEFSGAEKEVLLVIDATTGQNGLIQAKIFKESCDISGLILTKLDGTAKGGIVFPIVKELNVPIRYIGVGEKIDNLHEFDSESFVNAIFE